MSTSRPMPPSLFWLAGLVALAIVAALAGAAVLYGQDQARARRGAEALTSGRVKQGRTAIARYGCGGCHVIPGVTGAAGGVGPPLTGVAVRAHLAGALRNDPKTMMRWLQHPQQLRPGSGMPELGITAADAHDIAAYLYTLQ